MNCSKCGEKLRKKDEFCPKCGEKVLKEDVTEKKEEKVEIIEPKNENFFLGIIGAIIGSLAGVVLILGFNAIGFIASLSGLLMAFCALTLYQKFAGSLSTKGIIITIIIMVIATVLAVNAAFSIQVVKEVKAAGGSTTFAFVFKNIYSLMKQGYIIKSTYFTDLGMILLFTAFGAFGTIRGSLREIKG